MPFPVRLKFNFLANYANLYAPMGGGASIFSPLDLFAQGEQGAWYDPSDLTTLFQDAAGTIPVTVDGDPVGLMLDKSGNGNHATQSVSAARPTYRADGALHWLEFDGVDDWMYTSTVDLSSTSNVSLFTGQWALNQAGDISTLFATGPISDYRVELSVPHSEGRDVAVGLPTGFYKGSITNLTGVAHTISTFYDTTLPTADERVNISLDGADIALTEVAPAGTSAPAAAAMSIGNLVGRVYWFRGNVYSIVLTTKNLQNENSSDIHEYTALKAGVTL